ncbi:MAG: bacteriophage receptor, outer rane subunit [Bacteroidota bacterium]|nr:bacteriophage receptor, outer rane subunit [Bacteroidota bacterium]
MSRKNTKRAAIPDTQENPVKPATIPTRGIQSPGWAGYLILFVFTCLLYSNTIWNKYAIDDVIVLTDNSYTKKGFDGIKDILTHDTFQGYWGETGTKVLNGGRYRPLSLVTFAAEYELIRKLRHDPRSQITSRNVIIGSTDTFLSPKLSHAINMLLFALTGMLLYYLLRLLFPLSKKPFYLSLAFITAILYAAHPIHTEAIANIKGRDEIMSMLFSLLALLSAVKYVQTKKWWHRPVGALFFFLGLLSKENAITFFAIIPLTYYFFTSAKARDYVVSLCAFAVPVALFLILRNQFTHVQLTQEAGEVLDNPFLFATTTQHYATVIFSFLLYIKLLVFPHPLTHDYFYNQISYVDIGNLGFILSLLVNGALLLYALINFKKKTVISYAILFYFITFSIVSNLLFTVGSIMNDRFMYMSSLGFCILIAFGLLQAQNKFKLSNRILGLVILIVLSLYSVKTYTRNFDWADDATLISNDVRWSPNSAKIQTSMGNELTIQANKQTDTVEKIRLLDSALAHLRRALEIYPTHSMALLDMGTALYRRNHNPAEAIPYYEQAVAERPEFYDACYDLGVVYNDFGQAAKSKENLLKAISIEPGKSECAMLLAEVSAKLNQSDSVEYWLNFCSKLRPLQGRDYYLVGLGFGSGANNLDKAIEYLNKAISIDPNADLFYYDLGVGYTLGHRFDEAISTFNKLLSINPRYAAAYKNLGIIYNAKGDTALGKQYQEKYEQVLASLQKK